MNAKTLKTLNQYLSTSKSNEVLQEALVGRNFLENLFSILQDYFTRPEAFRITYEVGKQF